jgi:formate-dependent nitrite reductase membrane component NrfD
MSLVPWAAPVVLSIGMLFLWLDLENRWNVLRFYFAFRPASPMSWGSWILLAIYPVSLATSWVSLPASLRARVGERLKAVPGSALVSRRNGVREALTHFAARVVAHTRALALACIIGGATLGIYTGVLLGTMASRPLWNSAIMGPLFLVSGLSTGAAFLLLLRLDVHERITLARIDMMLIGVELLLLALWLVGLASGAAPARAAAALVLGGPYTAAFWTLVVMLGLVAPLTAEWLEHRQQHVPGRVAAVLVLIGGLALRWIMVDAGQHADIVVTIVGR